MRGVSRYDEARLQRRLWTPRELGAKLVAWYDYGDPASLTFSGSTVSQVANKARGGAGQMNGSGGGSRAFYPNLGPDGGGYVHKDAGAYFDAYHAAGTFAAGLTFCSLWRRNGGGETYSACPLNRTSGAIAAPIDGWDANRFIGTGGTYSSYPGSGVDMVYDPRVTAWNVFTQTLDGTSFNEYINGYRYLSLGAGYTDNTDVLTCGSRNDHVTGQNMHVIEQFAALFLSNPERQKLEAYMVWKRWKNGNPTLLQGSPYALRPPLIGD